MKSERISDNVVARLPAYYRCIEELYHANCIRVSSTTLSELLGFTAAQVRQDFSRFGEFGQQGYGYNVRKLRYEIREILGLNDRNTCILVGCGNLGQALLRNFNFEACGFFMVAAFDASETLIGKRISGMVISDYHSLQQFVHSEQPDMAVLAVPRQNAKAVADELAEYGVPAIWNFTSENLSIENVLVEQVSFVDSLLKLSYRLSEKRQNN